MDQLRLADGTLIATDDGKRTVNTEVNQNFNEDDRPSGGRPSQFDVGKRRYLDDLPMPFLASRPVAIVASYTMFGLTSGDISRILNVPSADITAIKESNDYAEFMNGILQNVREHDANAVRRKLNKHAKSAAKTIVTLLTSEKEDIQLKAAQDILNRTGHKPSDTVEHKHSMDGGITIRVIEDAKKQPTIEMEEFDG